MRDSLFAARLAFLEASSLFLALSGAMLLWGRLSLTTWIDVVGALGQGLGLSLCYVTTFYFTDLYNLRIVRTFRDFVPRLVKAVGLAFLVVTPFYLPFPQLGVTERVLTSSLVITAALVVALRAASYGLMRRRSFAERVLVVGSGVLTGKLIQEIEDRPHCGFTVSGIVDDASDGQAFLGRYPLLGPLRYLHKIVEGVAPDRIVVGLVERRGRLPVQQLLESRMRGIPVEDGLKFHERLTGKLAIETLTPSALIFAEDFRKSRSEMAFGRAVSLGVALLGLAVCAPFCLVFALAIKLDSRGPVFFLHERVGRYGKRFRLIKFRTMHPANGTTSEWERDNADRITRVGRGLRRFRLDELPQFINIIRGDMNLIGPRPHPVSNFELFTEKIPYYSLRSFVRPGVTGWAQIRHGYANNLDEETEKMRFDLFYIKHMSPLLDLQVLVETVKLVLFGREGR